MGYPRELFIKREIEEQFICVVCKDVVEAPKIVHPCEHAVCTNCSAGLKTCPKGCGNVATTTCSQRLFLELLENHEVRCRYKSNGCNVVVLLGGLSNHDNECNFNPDNRRTCEHFCGAMVGINRNKHNCVKYLKEKLMAKENEATLTKKELIDMEIAFTGEKMKLMTLENELKATKEVLNAMNEGPSHSKILRLSKDDENPVVICTRTWGINVNNYVKGVPGIIYNYVKLVVDLYAVVLKNNLATNPEHHKTDSFLQDFESKLRGSLDDKDWLVQITSIKWVTKEEGNQLQASQSQEPNVNIGLEFKVDLNDGYWVQVLLSRTDVNSAAFASSSVDDE